MDSLIDELVAIERRCRRGAALLEEAETKKTLQAILDAADEVERSWSGSWLGYQSCVYYADFEPRPPGAVFSTQWGFSGPSVLSPTRGAWLEYPREEVVAEVLRRAGNPDLEDLDRIGNKVTSIFEECHEELLAIFNATLAEAADKRLQELHDEIAKLEPVISPEALARDRAKGRHASSDRRAIEGGVCSPPHLSPKFGVMSLCSRAIALEQVGKTAKQARLYMEKRMNLKGKSMARKEGTVFIGHGGHSHAWRDLKDLLQDRLGLKPSEFNMEPAAGMTTKERLEEMLDSAVFAFLIMTAEDELADKTMRARENVVHEAGLFQGRLGFRRAIIMLEAGCSSFSNIAGLTYIPFPKGNIKAASEEIRRVLEREGLLPGK